MVNRVAVLILALFPAAEAYSGDRQDEHDRRERQAAQADHMIDLAAGIAVPAAARAVYTNPAGIAFTPGLLANARIRFPDETFRHPTGSVSLQAGDKRFGISAGFDSHALTYNLGLAVFSPEDHIGLGVSVFRNFLDEPVTDFTAGIILRPSTPLHLGLVVYNVSSPSFEWAVGAAYDAASWISTGLDFSWGPSPGMYLQPGIVLHAGPTLVAVSYGLTPGYGVATPPYPANSHFSTQGHSLGIRIPFKQSWEIDFQYKKSSSDFKYLGGITIRL